MSLHFLGSGGGSPAPVELFKQTFSVGLNPSAGFMTPAWAGGFTTTDPIDDGSSFGARAMFGIRAADLAVSGKTTKLRTRLTVRTNSVAPGVDMKARVFSTTWASASATTLTHTGNVEVDSANVPAPAANSTLTGQSAGVALPADGLYMIYLHYNGGPVASRQVVEFDVQAYYV